MAPCLGDALAILGSLATIYGTLLRQAEVRDHKQADAMAKNRTLSLKEEDWSRRRHWQRKNALPLGQGASSGRLVSIRSQGQLAQAAGFK
jgi:hypothetical protein